jgi:hypothetical protein
MNGNKQIRVEGRHAYPDELLSFKSFTTLVEIDEHEHLDRTLESELNHLGIIYKGLDMPPFVVIRINPDGKKPMFVERYTGALLETPTKHKGDVRTHEPMWFPSEHFQEKLDTILVRILPIYQAAMCDKLPEFLVNTDMLGLVNHMHHLENAVVHQELFFFEKRERELEKVMSTKKMRLSMKTFLDNRKCSPDVGFDESKEERTCPPAAGVCSMSD